MDYVKPTTVAQAMVDAGTAKLAIAPTDLFVRGILSGAILGFIVPLAAAIKYSVNLVDMVIWGLIALAVQIAAFVVVKFLVPSVAQDIEANNGAQGFFLGVTSLAAGLLNAACMSY